MTAGVCLVHVDERQLFRIHTLVDATRRHLTPAIGDVDALEEVLDKLERAFDPIDEEDADEPG